MAGLIEKRREWFARRFKMVFQDAESAVWSETDLILVVAISSGLIVVARLPNRLNELPEPTNHRARISLFLSRSPAR